MPRKSARYDVFLCHARGDVPLAGALRAALERLGCSAFSAEDDLRPGDRWHVAIPDAQDASRVIAIVISDRWGEGHYNHGELSTAINRYRQDDSRRIVPILFDGVGRGALPYGLETFAPLVGDRRAVDAVARSLLAIIDDAGRVELAADLSMATAALDDLEADGADDDALAEAREKVVQLKRALRAGGQLSAGDRLGGRYKLEEAVGDGGFATVWRAWDTVSKRRVAIKVLHAQHARDRSRRERFVRGARQMAAFDHPHIVPVHEPQAYDDGFRYFVMAWMPGGDLRAVVLDGGLDRARGRQVLLDVAEGLAAAHSRGLIHRDVKPGNILIDAEGRARLSDFDLVRAPDTTGGTRTGGLGTTLFAAPEAFTQAKDADERADVYGLGMTAAFILRGGPLPGWVLRKPEKLIEELDCSPALKAALHKAVEFEPEDRWESVAAFVEAIDLAWAEPSLPPGPPRIEREPLDFEATGPLWVAGREPADIGERVTQPGVEARRSPWSAMSLAGIAAFGLLSGGVGWYLAHRAGLTGVDAGVIDAAIVDALPPDAAPDAAPPDARSPDAAPPPPPIAAHLRDATAFRPGMVFVPGGRFEQGTPEGAEHRQDDEIRRPVELRPYFIAATPVTRAMYLRVFDQGGGTGHPKADVTWDQAISYCNRLSARESLPPAYVKKDGRWQRRPRSTGYRLPTEAEWERACLADGSPPGAPDTIAWYVGNSREQTHPVGKKAANALGLHDMLGNVWEWTEDIYGPYREGPVIDPRGPDEGRKRALRGASYLDPSHSLRCADRFAELPDQGQPWIGFRVARDVPSAEE